MWLIKNVPETCRNLPLLSVPRLEAENSKVSLKSFPFNITMSTVFENGRVPNKSENEMFPMSKSVRIPPELMSAISGLFGYFSFGHWSPNFKEIEGRIRMSCEESKQVYDSLFKDLIWISRSQFHKTHRSNHAVSDKITQGWFSISWDLKKDICCSNDLVVYIKSTDIISSI